MPMTSTSAVRDRFHPHVITYSRKVFLPLTNLCRDYCGYCTFRRDPGDAGAHTMTPEEVLETCRQLEDEGFAVNHRKTRIMRRGVRQHLAGLVANEHPNIIRADFDVLKATLQPAIGLPNTLGESQGFWELLNPAYGMGRQTAAYRGHLITYHGGDLPGFHSQVSFLPNDKIGVIVLVISDHSAPLYNIVSYDVYERLLGMDQTPWSQRRLQQRLAGKKAGTEARSKAGADRIPSTKPSHALADYAGDYENPAYGILKIALK